jgi:ABC-type uncharacterized transport system involved in gliding motility auxiliary subunit
MKLILVITNIILYLTTLALWIAIPDVIILNLSVSIIAILLTIALIIWNRDTFKKYYLSPQFNKLTSALISIILIFFILGLLNYLAFKHPIIWDFSSRKINSLTDQSVKVSKSLEKEIEIIAFEKKINLDRISELLDLYRSNSSKIKIKLVDVEINPAIVSQYKITQIPTLIVKTNNKIEKVLRVRELEISNAIVKVTRKDKPRIAFMTGHGEMSLKDKNAQGGSHLNALLSKSHFNISEINLLQESKIPDSIHVLVILGAKQAMTNEEIKKIDSYLSRGGKLFIGLDPQINGDNLENLRDLITAWGIKISNNLVIDKKSFVNGSNGTIPLVSEYPQKHSIVLNFKSQTFFPLVSSMKASQSPMHKGEFTSLVDSSPASWGESNPMELVQGKLSYNANQDIQGPVSLAAVWKSIDSKTRIVAFGNSTLLTNKYQKYGANYLLALNSLSWLSEQDRMISFNQPIIEDTPIFISKPQMGAIFYFSVVLLPLLFLLLALYMYWKRRKL